MILYWFFISLLFTLLLVLLSLYPTHTTQKYTLHVWYRSFIHYHNLNTLPSSLTIMKFFFGCLSVVVNPILAQVLAKVVATEAGSMIPKTIIQTSKEKSLDRLDWKEYQHSLKQSNPGFELLHYDDTEARSFIESHYANTTLVMAYEMVTPIMRADLFRLAVIYQHGGFYMDMDMLAKSSLDPIVVVIDSGEQYQAVFPKEWWWSDEVYHGIFPGREPEDSEDHWQMGQYAFAVRIISCVMLCCVVFDW